MFFNYDSLDLVVGVAVGVSFLGLIAYATYNIFTTNNGSLINTNSSPESISSNNPDLTVSSINNTPINNVDGVNYVNAAVQTESKTLWQSFKGWLKDVFSVPDTEIGTFGHSKVEKWRDELNSVQSMDVTQHQDLKGKGVANVDTSLNNLVNPIVYLMYQK